MTKKILFLLTFLLCLTGGGELWAEQVTFKLANGSSSDTRVSPVSLTTDGNFRTDNDNPSRNGLNIDKGQYFELTADAGYSISKVQITFTPDGDNISSGKITSITINTDETASWGQTFLSKNYATYGVLRRTLVEPKSSIKFSFDGSEGFVYVKQLDVTYGKVPYSGTMPYTWNFHHGGGSNYWPYTTGEMLTANSNSKWTTSGSDYLYQLTPSGAALVDGNNDAISETSGLTFTATAGNIWTDLNTGVGLKNNASVTIPAKTGQKIAVYAYWPKETMTLKNAKENTSNASTFEPTSAGADTYYFTATADNVTLQANTNNLFIYSIAVTKTDVSLTKRGTWPTTKTYGDAAFTVSLNYTAGTPTTKSLWTIEKVSGDDGVITWSDIDGNKGFNSNNWMSFNNLTPGNPGSVTLRFKFVGNDVYNPAWIEETFTVNKTAQNLSFEQSSYTINYGTTGVSHTATLSQVTGANVTYSSSDNTVATVDESTGVITTVNSGTCEITATAAETAEYAEATASYTLTVTGSKTPTLKWTATNNGDTYTVADLPYGNSKYYKAAINTTDNSDVTASDIRYGVVEEYEGYLTVGATDGKIQPTRKFADENLEYKEVQVYAYTPSSGDRNASPRILYNVKIVKGTFSDDLFKENELYVNVGHTIAPKNNLQSMRWEDIDNITVSIQTGSDVVAVSGDGDNMVDDYKTASPRATYFDIKTPTSGDNAGHEVVDWFYPIFKGKTTGVVKFIVTLKSKLYGDKSGDFTLHVLEEETTTGFAWADGTKTKYTIYEGDYMLLPEITGNTNGNFSYSVGAANQSTHHKYVYTRRWDGSKYVTTYNNKNFHKGEGFPNFDLTSDASGNTPVPEVQADGSDVALLFWNTGTGTEHDQLLIYGNKEGTVYLKASDPQVTRSLPTIEIEVKSRSAIDDDFESLKSSMTFPYTWDFTTDYNWSAEIETGTGNWKLNGSSYDLGMSSNINYDYADEDKNEKVWGNDNNDPTTDSNELTDKLLVGKDDKVLRGFAGMKIRLGNNGTGSWYSKRDGIHILPYINSSTPRLRVTTGTHTLILPTPTGSNCPETFKVFVKAKALEAGEGTLWVRNADLDRNASGQNKYHDFKSASEGDVIIYSVNASKGQSLELDLDKVDIYWIAYSTEANNTAKPSVNQTLKYAATSYSYGKALDLAKSEEVNNGLTAYYAKTFTNGEDAASAVTLRQVTLDQKRVRANTGLVLKSNNPLTNYMIADAENQDSYSEPTELSKNYLVAGDGTTVSSTTGSDENIKTNFILSYAYKKFADDGTTAMTGYQYNRDWSFYKVMPSATVPVGKAYLQVDGNLRVKSDGTIETITPSGSRRAADGSDDDRPANKLMLDIVYEDEAHGFDATTAINDVKTDTVTVDDDAWYTLQGVRVNTPARGGIYIHNGRKVVIK